jgi:type VI secretion system protein ImpC
MPDIPPFCILALAPFGPVPSGGYKPAVIRADLYTLDEAAASVAPRFWIELAREACPEGGITVGVDSLAGFKPENLVRNTPYLASLAAAHDFIRDARNAGTAPATLAGSVRERFPGLPLALTLPAPSASPARTPSESAVDDILSMVASGPAAPAGGQEDGSGGQGGAFEGPAAWQAKALDILSRCLAGVFADEAFRTCEAAWSGARLLARQAGIKQGGQAELKLVSVSPDTLQDALAGLIPLLALDVPQLTVIDHAFGNTPASIETLNSVAAFAEALLTPTAVELSPAFFNIGGWERLSRLGYLSHALEDAAYAKFRKLREHPGASRLCALINRLLARAPYGPDNPARPAAFAEPAPLWVSPVWGLATLCAKSAMEYGWPTRFTDSANVRLEELAVAGSGQGPLPVMGLFGEDQTAELIEAGITPLLGAPGRDFAIIPRQATLDGGSFAFQLFFGRVIGWLLAVRETAGEAAASDPAGCVRQALAGLFVKTGQKLPQDLSVEAGEETDGRVPLFIAFTPPGRIYGGGRLTFTFAW